MSGIFISFMCVHILCLVLKAYTGTDFADSICLFYIRHIKNEIPPRNAVRYPFVCTHQHTVTGRICSLDLLSTVRYR